MTMTKSYSPGLEGVVAGETTLSFVNPERSSLMYRGYDIRDLAEHSSYEEVAYLLLYGQLPTPKAFDEFKITLTRERTLPGEVVDLMRRLPTQGIHPMDSLRTATAILAMYDPEVADNSHDANVRKAVRLTAKFPTMIAYNYRLAQGKELLEPQDGSVSHAKNFLYMLFGQKPDDFFARVFDISLMAYADHGFNASTFCARVSASTLSDLHSSIVAAIGTLKGPLHGGANEEAMKMMLEIGSPDKADAWMHDALANKKKIMGFGHRAYKKGDPRAVLLAELGHTLGERLGQTKWDEMGTIITNIMVNEKGIHPNVDFPTAYIYYMMGLPIDIYTPIFALSRVAGWSAHVIEQLDNNRLIRPNALYEGPSHQPYTPISSR